MAYLYMFRQLWRYAGAERWKIVVYLLIHVISVLGEIGKPLAFAMVIDALQANHPTLIAEVLHWLGVYVLCFFTFEVFHRFARYLEVPVAYRSRGRFVQAMYDKLQSLPLRWHTDNHSGNVINRVNVAAKAVHLFGVAQMNYVSVFLKCVGPLIILWQLSPQISVVSLLTGGLIVVITRKLYQITVPLYRRQNEELHNFAAAFFDYMSNMRTVITLRLGRHVKQDLDARFARVFPFIMSEMHVTQVKCVCSSLLMLLLEVGVTFYYIWSRKQAGAVIMIGSVTAIFQYLQQLVELGQLLYIRL